MKAVVSQNRPNMVACKLKDAMLLTAQRKERYEDLRCSGQKVDPWL
jgi:hypothetical protein